MVGHIHNRSFHLNNNLINSAVPVQARAMMVPMGGGLALLVGLLSRVAALGIICNMIVATVMVHAHVGFFMNWTGAQKGEGFEYHLLAIALALLTALRGAGALSLDRAISAHLASERRDAVRHGAAESLSHA